MGLSGLGLHVVDGEFSAAKRAVWEQWVLDLEPTYSNIHRAGQEREALEAAKYIAATTSTKIMVRNAYGALSDGDERILTIYGGVGDDGPARYFNDFIYQYRDTGLIPVLANEITLDNYDFYSWFFGEVIELAAAYGITVAVARFPTHHPLEDAWDSLIPLWETMKRYRNAIYSPNGYWDGINFDGINKQVRFVNYMEQKTQYRPVVVFGEFARLRNLTDAFVGWKGVPLSEDMYADELIEVFQWLRMVGFHACIFSVGDWKASFGLTQKIVARLIAAKERLDMSENEVFTEVECREAGVRLRKSPVNGEIVDKTDFVGQRAYATESPATVAQKIAAPQSANQWIYIRMERGTEGWTAAWLWKVAPAPEEPEPDPETEPEEPQTDAQKIAYLMSAMKSVLEWQVQAGVTLGQMKIDIAFLMENNAPSAGLEQLNTRLNNLERQMQNKVNVAEFEAFFVEALKSTVNSIK